jgi:hypothetical protein
MFPEEKCSLLDFDIYSRRIRFFYQSKEKLGSTFGFILTLLYVVLSIILFFIYFIKTVKREEVTASDSTIYPEGIPAIEINRDRLYLAFGLEHPTKMTRFIDERIYYPEVIFVERVKENGELIKRAETVLKLERCSKSKFGEKYQILLENEDLNNSYCLQDYNLSLVGGFKYDKMSYFKINIFSCVNNTNNNNHCKPQDEIDKYLNAGYFSALIKDIGLNPFNFSFPTVPILQDLYTTIDKFTKKEYFLYFGITEIDTDVGLFTNKVNKEIHLKFQNDIANTFFVDNEENQKNTTKEIFTAQIRLEDNIHFQKRTYTKMSLVFSTTGGYMQVIYTILTLIALLTKKFSVEKKLLNSLFNFNIKQKKIILSIEYEKKLDYNASFDKNKGKENCFIPYEAKKSIVSNRGRRNSIFFLNRNINKIPVIKNSGSESVSVRKKGRKTQNYVSEEGLIDIFRNISKENEKNENINQSLNRSKNNMIDNSNLNNLQINRILEKKIVSQKSNFNFSMIKDKTFEKGNCSIIHFNIFDYYCLRKITKKKTEIDLFNFGINFYKRQMDIINFFNIMILTQIMLTQKSEKKHNILSHTVELSMN